MRRLRKAEVHEVGLMPGLAGLAVWMIVTMIMPGLATQKPSASTGIVSPMSSITVSNTADSGVGSLRQAIIDSLAGDTINFNLPPGSTITLTSGELLINKNLTIAGPGASSLTVSGNNASRVFEIAGATTVTVSDLTINNGSNATGNAGAVLINVGCALTIIRSTVANSSAGTSGGGIFNDGALTIANSTLSGNSALGFGGGGAVSNSAGATLTISNSTLSGNSGYFGGGIVNQGTLTITNSTLSGNSTRTFEGGGIFNGGSLTITNSTLSLNSTPAFGGGIYNVAATVTISNSTLSGNSALFGGGVFNNSTAPMTIANSTLSGNSAGTGGGIGNFGAVVSKNSIVANSSSGGGYAGAGTLTVLGVNVSTDGSCPGFTQVTPAQLNLGALSNNGGPTQTHALLPGSVAIDAVIDCTNVDGSPVTRDQRGGARPIDGDGNGIAFCDVGAFELQCLVCPADVTQQTDPGECGAVVNYPPPQINEGCGSVTCTPASGLFFPVGTTTVTCTNQEIILRPKPNGPLGGSCVPNTVTESTSQEITAQNSFSCNNGSGHSDSSYWRAFTLTAFSITNNFDVQSIDIGIESATSGGAAAKPASKGSAFIRNNQKGNAPKGGPGQPLTLRLYTNTGGAFPGGTRSLIGAANYTIPDQALTIVNLPITATVPAGSELVVEVFTPNGQKAGNLFFIGSNAELETGLSYVSATDCKIADPTPTADIDFPDMHIVMNVNGCEEITSCTFNVTVRDTQPPSITCPANITKTTDLNQCTAIVVYPDPAVSDTCPTGSLVCAPASGSAFPKGATTVTCSVSDSFGNSASCSLTVTVNDTQPPQITCPANVTAVTDQNTCPNPACQAVNYAAPVVSDNCPGVNVVCNPPSGSCFPVGVTTVTCTATDASGNTATCALALTTFDVALQDDSNPSTILLWNSITGAYRFCCNGITFTGVGKATRQGCVYTLDQTNAIDRRVLGRVDKAAHAGSGSIQAPPGTIRCTITDRNTLNDTNVTSCQ